MGGSGGMGGAAGTAGAADAADADCHDPTDNSTALFKCVLYDKATNERRCLNPCVQDQDCRHGRVCLTKCAKGDQCASGVCGTTDGQCHPRPQTVPCKANEECTSGMCELTDTTSPNYMKCLAESGKPFDPNACDGQRMCLTGETCVDGQCELQSFCADGPPLAADKCFPQLTSYQINVNAGFLVTGTQAGSYAAGESGPNGCQPQSNRDERLQSRIPLRPYLGQDLATTPIECGPTPKDVFPTLQTTTASADGFYIDRFDPALKPIEAKGKIGLSPSGARQEAPQLVAWMKSWTTDVSAPNACLYMGGPIASEKYDPDPSMRLPQHVRARFRNTQVAFVLTNIDRAPPTATTLHFDVHGGFRQESVVNLTTVQVSAPARLVLGPIDSTRIDMVPTKAAPFFFVVDQRRLGTGQGGGPTRGQIVRVNPFGLAANGYLPVYEDYTASHGLFPIQ
jgi:hypothetical protein